MTIPIYKKNIFDKMKNKQNEIADSIPLDDKIEIQRLVGSLRKKRDARGNWAIRNDLGKELLVYFKKYVDPNVKENIFGCGGCATKMVNFMNNIYNIWQNQMK